MRKKKTTQNMLNVFGVRVLIVIVTGTLLVNFVSSICPFVFQHLLFWSRRAYINPDNFNLYDPRYFAIPAYVLAGAILIGWKMAMKIQAHPTSVAYFEGSNPPDAIKQVINQIGLRAAFFCSFVFSSIVFIEGTFPLYGIGRLFRSSSLANDWSSLNTILFLSGLILIGVSFTVQVIYALLQFGPYQFHRFGFIKFALEKSYLKYKTASKSDGALPWTSVKLHRHAR